MKHHNDNEPNDTADSTEAYQEMKDNLRDRECAVLHADGSATFCGKPLGKIGREFPNQDAALAAITQTMKEQQFWPNIYSINDHGNVSLLDHTGKEIASWV